MHLNKDMFKNNNIEKKVKRVLVILIKYKFKAIIIKNSFGIASYLYFGKFLFFKTTRLGENMRSKENNKN